MIRAWAALGLVLCAGMLSAADTSWTEDFTAALQRAEKEKKDILLDFTGSDWCHWCVKLHEEVFNQDAFKKEAPEKYVLVLLDFPRQKEQNEAVKQQNKMLAETFQIQGFPTVIVLDSKGRPYARTGYQAGGAEPYLKHLGELRAKREDRDKLLTLAEASKGADKAKLLDQALTTVSDQIGSLAGYDELVDQLIAADADNAGGFKTKYGGIKALKEIETERAQGGDPAATLAKLEKFMAEQKPAGEVLQRALFEKAMLIHAAKNKEMVAILQEALKAAPESQKAQELQGILQQLGGGGE